MQSYLRARVYLPVLISFAIGSSAMAQVHGDPVETRLMEIESQVAKLTQNTTDAAAAMKIAADLQSQVAALKQELAQLRTMSQGYDQARQQIQDYQKRMDTMVLELETLKMQLTGPGKVAGYDDGFYLQSLNRRFRLRLRALLQAAYWGKIFQDARIYDEGSLGQNESSFALRRAALETSGHVFLSQLSYGLVLDFGTVDPGPLLEAFGDFRLHPVLNVRVGKQKVVFGGQFLQRSADQQFVERSLVVDAFRAGWDLGLLLHGELALGGRLSYQLGMYNGSGAQAARDDNLDFLYAVRLSYEPLGPVYPARGASRARPFSLALGGAFTYNLANTDLDLRNGITDPQKIEAARDGDGDGKVDTVNIYAMGVELAARYRALLLQNELFYRREDPGAVGLDRSFVGVYSQLGLTLLQRHLECAARYGYVEPHNYGLERQILRPAKIHELSLVVNLLVWKGLVKWQAEYAHQWQRELSSATRTMDANVNLNRIQLQAQVAF